MPNPKASLRPRPAIQVPTQDPRSLQTTASQLKDAVEILQGQSGKNKNEAAVRWQDLLDLGLIAPEQVPR